MEKWKDITNYEGIYQVSNLGNIRSLTFRNNKVNKKRKKPLLMKYSTRSGYYNVNLRNKNGRKSYQVHRLVAEAFIDNPLNKKIVNHKDFNPLNNNVNNLEWCTQKENVNWSICNMKHRKSITNTNTGEKYIYYRESTKKYRIVIDKKEYKNCLTLEEAIKKRDEILNEKV